MRLSLEQRKERFLSPKESGENLFGVSMSIEIRGTASGTATCPWPTCTWEAQFEYDLSGKLSGITRWRCDGCKRLVNEAWDLESLSEATATLTMGPCEDAWHTGHGILAPQCPGCGERAADSTQDLFAGASS